jgi:hypothetical protein
VDNALPLLQRMGLKAEPPAVAAVLARHALALHPMLQLPAHPVGAGWCSELAAAGGARGAAAAAGAVGVSSSGAAAVSVAPDAVLAICLSRTCSVTAAGVASPLLSRAGSLAQPALCSGPAAASTAVQKPLLSAAAAAGSLTPPAAAVAAASTGPGWGAGKQQPEGADSAAAGKLLGLSWELAHQAGDKLAAVAACSGAQFSCMVLPQQPQQHGAHGPQQHPHQRQQAHLQQQMQQPGRSLARPRPLVFASRAGGIGAAELLAPTTLPAHWAATHHHKQQQQQHGRVQPPTSSSSSSGGNAHALGAPSPFAAASSGSLSGFMSQVGAVCGCG